MKYVKTVQCMLRQLNRDIHALYIQVFVLPKHLKKTLASLSFQIQISYLTCPQCFLEGVVHVYCATLLANFQKIAWVSRNGHDWFFFAEDIKYIFVLLEILEDSDVRVTERFQRRQRSILCTVDSLQMNQGKVTSTLGVSKESSAQNIKLKQKRKANHQLLM